MVLELHVKYDIFINTHDFQEFTIVTYGQKKLKGSITLFSNKHQSHKVYNLIYTF
jgi:hypothetical protein